MQCQRFLPVPLSRRALLAQAAHGFGAVAFAALHAHAARSEESALDRARGMHHRPRARSVIFLFMDGGPSQVDTFDPKPRLDREHGQPIKMKTPPTQFNDVGNVLKSPWIFREHGQSGIPVSSLFPEVARHVDDLAIIRSMVANFSEHTQANYFLHTGSGLQGRPSHGAWIGYGLGSESQELPGFVVLNGGLIPPGGIDCFGSGFLPASYQASILKAGATPIENLTPGAGQDRARALIRELDRFGADHLGVHDAVESAIRNEELAARMQTSVPELVDVASESRATRNLYGLDHEYPPTRIYAQQCLLARRLVERGVRFVEVLCPQVSGDRWDQHSDLKSGHENNARATDQPIAALLTDLKARGLLDSTLVVWAGEFGRTPMAQGTNGRDHNPFGFTIWLAGGGTRGGTIHGATDDYGYFAVENPVSIHDLHATMLHLLGVDHRRQTYRFGGREMRLTDVHGEVVYPILA